MYISLCALSLFLFYEIESTDIVAVYKHGVVLLQNANEIPASELPLDVQDPAIKLLYDKLAYPIGLSYDPFSETLFVADANSRDAEIFSYSLESGASMKTFISKIGRSAIDSITFDPVKGEVMWADSIKHGIYKAEITKSADKISGRKLITTTNVYQPRGIAFDYCKGNTYWTERDDIKPTIEVHSTTTNSVKVYRNASRGVYFQAITYDGLNRDLIWAETVGDEEKNSSCTIVTKSLETGDEKKHSFDKCYPFSMAADKDYIYWSDWSREAIMRLERQEPYNLVKLINTPQVSTKAGGHNGAFGVVNLQSVFLDGNSCLKQRSDVDTYYASYSKNQVGNPPVNSFSKLFADVTTISQAVTLDDIENERLEAKQSDIQKKESREASIGSSVDTISKISQTEHSIEESTEAADHDSHSIVSTADLPFIIIIVSGLCVFFLATTIILLARNVITKKSYLKSVKGIFATVPASDPISPKKIKRHRTFGAKPHKMDGQLCPREDGVKIDIEDCCQMTLCETPCYTSVKKEGKSYKHGSKSQDKTRLLDDDA